MKRFLTQILLCVGLAGCFSYAASAPWVQTAGLTVQNVTAFAIKGTTVFAGSNSGGVFLSTNSGTSWAPVNDGLTNHFVSSIALTGNKVFAGTHGGGVFLSTNNGTSWTPVNSGLQDTDVFSLGVLGTVIYSGTKSAIYKLKIGSANWTLADSGLMSFSVPVYAFAVIDSLIFAGTNFGVWVSTDTGASWNQTGVGGPESSAQYISLAVTGNTIFAATQPYFIVSRSKGLTDDSWETPSFATNNISALAVGDSNLFIGTLDSGIYYQSLSSIDDSGYVHISKSEMLNVSSLAASGDTIFAGTPSNGIFRSTDGGTSWTSLNEGFNFLTVHSFGINDSTLWAGTDAGVLISTNDGQSWSEVNSGITERNVLTIATSGSSVFAGTSDSGIFLSTNKGTSWTAVNVGLTEKKVVSLATNGNHVFAGTQDSGVFRSINNGISWSAVDSGLPDTKIVALAASGSNIYLQLLGAGSFFKCSDTSAKVNWVHLCDNLVVDGYDMGNNPVNSFAVDGDRVFVETAYFWSNGPLRFQHFIGGLFRSNDNGMSFSAAGFPWDTSAKVLAANGTTLIAGNTGQLDVFTDSNNVLLTTDNCQTWAAIDSGLPNSTVLALAIRGNTLFAGTQDNGIFRRPLDIIPVSNHTPIQATAKQRSFRIRSLGSLNTNLAIEFSLPNSKQVAISIFDLSGHEIATLVNKRFEPGDHRLTWNTRSVATGCYVVRMQAGSDRFAKSMPIFR